ncbi:hypothetical protein XU18_1195 [Perkinsela sp. CCAP 1560/4]|nr:hypothetical protein XU18_1195 [Perkinsela sp. CCAP 1560/4]|eukprot:KNH08187.1 hypothetical protein XU18_1195 [Perkinsela sp. CCAP 1560/4]
MPPLVRILIGSETGFAREIGTQIALDLQEHKILTECECHPLPKLCVELHMLDDFLVLQQQDNQLRNKFRVKKADITLFVVSTTGDGDCPSTMSVAWKKMLNRNTKLEFLHNSGESLRFSVFGLGDSGYEKFNVVAKMLYNRMSQLGGEPLAFRGIGDENDMHAVSLTDYRVFSKENYTVSDCPALEKKRTGVYVELVPWIHEVRRTISMHFPPSTSECWSKNRSATARLPPIKYALVYPRMQISVDLSNDEIGTCSTYLSSYNTSNKPAVAYVTSNKRITSGEHFQDVRHVEFVACPGISDGKSNIQPCPGGLFGFYPPNSLLSVMNIIRFIALPVNTLNEVDSTMKARNLDFDNPKDALFEVCSSEVLPILRRELRNQAIDDMQIMGLIYACTVCVYIDNVPTSRESDQNCRKHIPAKDAETTEGTANENGNLYFGIASTEEFYCRKMVSLLDFLVFAVDLEKPPRRCFLRQLLFWFTQPHTLKGKTISEYVNELNRPINELCFNEEESSLMEEVQGKIVEFTSCSDTQEYENYFIKEYRGVAEFLNDFDSIFGGTGRSSSPFIIPLGDFVSYCPFLLPRLYSLSNSFPSEALRNNSLDLIPSHNLSITVGIIEFRTVNGRLRLGQVSRYIGESVDADDISCALPRPFFRPGKIDNGFVYSTDPIVFLATGIGVSACRSIYLSREQFFGKKCIENNNSNGEQSLDAFLYGCRYSTKDFLYKSDFSRYFAELTENGKYPTVAFSREHTDRKVYIQILLYDPCRTINIANDVGFAEPHVPTGNTAHIPIGQYIAQMITSKNASIFVCGTSKSLPREIREALAFILVEYNSEIKDEEEARKFLNHLTRMRKFVMDTW